VLTLIALGIKSAGKIDFKCSR